MRLYCATHLLGTTFELSFSKKNIIIEILSNPFSLTGDLNISVKERMQKKEKIQQITLFLYFSIVW